MRKIVTEIDRPDEWKAMDDYGSHLPALWLVLNKASNIPFTEMGCGLRSTPLLAEKCNSQKRVFEYIDTDSVWLDKVSSILEENMQFAAIKGLYKSCLDVEHIEGNILFIDSKPGHERKDILMKWKDDCSVIIVHDTEPGAISIYGIGEALDSFKYRLDFIPDKLPGTSILSNYLNVAEWVNY